MILRGQGRLCRNTLQKCGVRHERDHGHQHARHDARDERDAHRERADEEHARTDHRGHLGHTRSRERITHRG